tara:strand:+ start:3232 stop:4335 length:1104 start_codon:yes stop_codon:yes gene_type:complete
MYDTLIGKQRGLIFPVMCNGHVRIDYSDNVPSTSDNQAYGIFAHEGNFTFETILTPYDINGFGQYSATARPTVTATTKVMPSAIFSDASSADPQSNEYMPIANRLVHEMNLFSSTNLTIALVNSTLHNENQPAEYKIKVTIKLGSTDYTVTTDSTVINATSGFGWFYTADTLEGFDRSGRITHVVGGVTDGSNSTTTVPVASTAKFHVGQEVFTRSGFTFTSLGTIASINSGVSIVLNTAPSSSISTSTNIFISAYKDPSYINNNFHIACSYNELGKEVKIFLDGLLIKRQTLSTTDTFSMAQEDYFIGASSNNGTGTESAIANKQFMGELHEMSMVNTTRKKFSINNLAPNADSTLFYFRFEEVDI